MLKPEEQDENFTHPFIILFATGERKEIMATVSVIAPSVNTKCEHCCGDKCGSHHRVDLTSGFSLALMRITIQTQLLNLNLHPQNGTNVMKSFSFEEKNSLVWLLINSGNQDFTNAAAY